MFRSVITTLGTFINKWPRLFLFLLLVLMSFAYNYHKIIELPPRSIHQWRQADCASFAYTYYAENRSFFEPAILNGGRDGTGRTIAEFPIIYFIVGKLWQVSGHHDWIFRIIQILIVFSGLLALFTFCHYFLKDTFWSMAIPILIFTSPVLVFYTNNYLPNAPAFGLVLVGWLFFGKYYMNQQLKYLLIMVLIFTLAGLLKISTAISYIALIAVFIAEHYKFMRFSNNRMVFKHSIKEIIVLSILPATIILWTIYARKYNDTHSGGFFIHKIMPIWQSDSVDKKEILDELFLRHIPALLNRITFYIVVILFLLNLVFIRKANRFLVTISILLLCGISLYIVLFYEQFYVHDYYIIEALIFPVFVLLTTLEMIHRNFPKTKSSAAFKLLAFMGIIISVYITIGFNRLKYDADSCLAISNPFIKEGYVRTWKKHHSKYDQTYKALESITPYLRSINIRYNDLVLSIPDNSYNISLYLMKQKGYRIRKNDNYNNQIMSNKLAKNVKFLVIFNTRVYDWEFIQPYLNYKIGSYKNVDIYDLRPYKNP